MPAEWGLIALVERKMRHTLGGGQCSERVYVTKYHHSTSRTGLISDSYRKGLADPESGMDENSKERLVPEREGAKHPRYPALLFVRKWFRALYGNHVVDEDDGGIGRDLDRGVDHALQVVLRLRLFEHAPDEPVGLFLAILLELVHPSRDAGNHLRAGLLREKSIHQHNPPDIIGAELFGILRQFAARHRPAHEDRVLQAKLIHEFFVVARPGFGHVAVGRLVALALRTRIDGNDVISLRELIDLLLPDPGRHRPARNEYDCASAASLKVVDTDAVGSFEEPALRCLR